MNDKPRRQAAGQSPVSAHPAFPVIVALWFAALLGLGSLVLPTALFERFITGSGLAEVYEAARPPLGVTARIAIALAAAALGALAGIAIARKVSAANTPQPVTRRAAALRSAAQSAPMAVKRPISAHEELGAGGLDADRESGPEDQLVRHAPTGRRRALSISDESARSDFLDFAPLPGQSYAAAATQPLDLIAYAEPADPAAEEPAAVRETAPDSSSVFDSGALSLLPGQTSSPETTMTDPIASPAFVRREDTAPALEPVGFAADTAPSGLGALAIVELVDRFALALESHRRPAKAIGEPEQGPAEAAETVAADVATAPFTAPLSAQYTAQYSAYTPPVPAIPAALHPIGFENDDHETEGLPDLDLTAALTRAAPKNAAPAPSPAHPLPAPFAALTLPDENGGDDDDTDEAGEQGYTSLLAMKGPFGLPREPVRIEDDIDGDGAIEPVVVFPGQAIRKASPAPDGPSRDAGSSMAGGVRLFDAPLERVQQAAATGGRPFAAPGSQQAADPGKTERALREALEKLQKMSGVG